MKKYDRYIKRAYRALSEQEKKEVERIHHKASIPGSVITFIGVLYAVFSTSIFSNSFSYFFGGDSSVSRALLWADVVSDGVTFIAIMLVSWLLGYIINQFSFSFYSSKYSIYNKKLGEYACSKEKDNDQDELDEPDSPIANATAKKHHEPLIHIAKRDDIAGWKAWLIRFSAILIGFLVMSLVLSALANASFGKDVGFADVMDRMLKSVFGRMFEGGKLTQMWKFLQETAILLCLSLAVTPAFKMKFWNCGAEGQALFGGLAAMFCMINFGGKMPEYLLIPLVIVASIVGGALWGLIPALFHAQYRTNETLFTLMMNYVATQLVAYYVYANGQGSNVITPVSTGALPVIGGEQYLLNVLIVAVLTVLMFIYLRYSKQGYEVSVVGESQNTARYIGINVKKVIIRTMVISGALCGVAGMLLVAGKDHSINTATVGGQGFTAIMVAWLGQFNPFIIAGMAALVSALQIGAAGVADAYFLNSAYADVMVGVVVLCLVACEFFVRYTVKFRHAKKGGASV